MQPVPADDRLSVSAIHYITRRKNTWDTSLNGILALTRVNYQIASIHRQLIFKYARVGGMTNRDKHTVHQSPDFHDHAIHGVQFD